MPSSNSPIFFNNSGRRWRLVKTVVQIASLLIAAIFTVVVVNTLSKTDIVLPKLIGENEVYKKVLNPDRFTTLRTQQNDAFTKARNSLEGVNAFDPVKASSPPSRRPLHPEEQVRAGFFVNWDPQAFYSLRTNISKMNVVIPEWLFVPEKGTSVVTDIDQRALSLIREHNVPVMAMLSNYAGGEFQGELVHKIIATKASRTAFVKSILATLEANKFVGVNVDFEELVDRTDENLIAFQRELYETLHPLGLLVTQDFSPFNDDYDPKRLAAYNDYLIVMAYDLHSASSEPGAISDARWVSLALSSIMKKVPLSKVVFGLAAYGYDWPEGHSGEDITYQEAVVNAKESEAPVLFDTLSSNLNYSYQDDNDVNHTVWFTDASTDFNLMRIAADYGTRGVALWRLGSEDARIWRFFNSDLRHETLTKSPFDPAGLEYFPATTDLDYEGEGEILDVVAVPTNGKLRLTFDRQKQVITGQVYETLPSSYVIKKFGIEGKRVVLSFDDGPDGRYTPKILDILKQEHIPATFFVVGINAENNLPLLSRIYKEGHEIGNHTFTHPNLADITPERATLELNATRKIIESVTGHSTVLFRPPYNADSEPETAAEILPVVSAKEHSYYTVGESIDPLDWEPGVTAAKILERINAEVNQGSIVLLHDAGGDRSETVKALPEIIKYFRDKGYQFTTVASLISKTRDDVMPPLVNSNDRLFARFNWSVAYTLFVGGRTVSVLFILAIVLSITRVVLVAILAIIEKRRSDKNPPSRQDLPGISIIVPAYNERTNIERTITNLATIDYPLFEIVIVDDGSTDGTSEAVRELCEKFPLLTLVTKPNGGKASALNVGITSAKYEYLLCIDADTQLEKSAVRKLVQYLDNENVGGIAGNVKVGNQVNLLTRWQALEYISSQNLDRRAFGLLNAITVIPGAIGLFRRDAVAKAGGFTTDTLAEDCDLTLRLLIEGYTVRAAPEAIAYTEAPETLRMFLRQRFRWSFGVMQSIWKHKDSLFELQQWHVGFIALPQAILFQFILPLLAPLADLVLLLSLIAGTWGESLHYYILFTVVDFIGAAIAITLERESYTRLILLIPQKIVYRQLMYYVLAKSFLAALRGTLVGWGVLKRTGNVQVSVTQN